MQHVTQLEKKQKKKQEEKTGGGGLCHVLSDVYDVSLKSTPSAFFRKLHPLKVL